MSRFSRTQATAPLPVAQLVSGEIMPAHIVPHRLPDGYRYMTL